METSVVYGDRQDVVKLSGEILRRGGLVAFPTDTVYGLGALPSDQAAVARIYEVKRRSLSQPIALLISDLDRLAEVANMPRSARPLAERFWPGGLTLILPKTEAVCDEVSAGPGVGVRIPDLQLARAIIRGAGGALAVTSANRSGEPAALRAEEVLGQLGGRIELLVDGGPCPGGIPSTVLDCTVWPPLILRHGAVAEATIRSTIDCAGVEKRTNSAG